MTDWIAEKNRLASDMRACETDSALRAVWVAEQSAIHALRAGDAALGAQIVNLKDYLRQGFGGRR